MTMADLKRRLVWHGVLLFFLALVEGMFVYSMRNPRMVSRRTSGPSTTALFFLGVAAAWDQLRLSLRAATATWWLTVVGGWGSQRRAPPRRSPRDEQRDADRRWPATPRRRGRRRS
jgi:hypothetical protein